MRVADEGQAARGHWSGGGEDRERRRRGRHDSQQGPCGGLCVSPLRMILGALTLGCCPSLVNAGLGAEGAGATGGGGCSSSLRTMLPKRAPGAGWRRPPAVVER